MTPTLQLRNVIGFDGKIPQGLHCHPDGKHILFPLGSTIVIRNIATNQNTFLMGHSGPISCFAVSKSGKYIISGQSTYMGFKADAIIWDFETRSLLHKLTVHKALVQSAAFSKDEQYVVTAGGEDDNTITIWSVKEGKRVCGSACPAAQCVTFFNNRNDMLVVGGKFMLKVWEIDYVSKKMTATDCNLGHLRRIVSCFALDTKDAMLYCGTTSGDVLAVQVQGPKIYKFVGPKTLISCGVVSCCFNIDGSLLFVGGGDGTLAALNVSNLLQHKATKLMGSVTSISPHSKDKYFVGTAQSVIYTLNQASLEATLMTTCHPARINDVCYPEGTSEIIATCSQQDIRLWNAHKCRELVRIQVANLECNCITFNTNGTIILSGWSDGKIRAFAPQSGKLLFVIHDAHKIITNNSTGYLNGVTALVINKKGDVIVSGGADGQVRVWSLNNLQTSLIATMKEHKGVVNRIAIKTDTTECISASDDGSCIIWNLIKHVRSNIIYSQTYFKQVCYLNDESQILTAGSDRKITFYDAYDCSVIREIEASENEVRALDIGSKGLLYLSGGNDKLVKLWDYDLAQIYSTGQGHSLPITQVKMSSDEQYVTSVGEEGAIFIWQVIH